MLLLRFWVDDPPTGSGALEVWDALHAAVRAQPREYFSNNSSCCNVSVQDMFRRLRTVPFPG